MARRWLIVILLTLSFLSACNNATDTSTTPSSSNQAHFQFVENTKNSEQKNYLAKSNTVETQVYEGQSNHINYFKLAISSPFDRDASVFYQTRDGTAKAGQDYIATSGTATIPAGETSVLIGIEIVADHFAEFDETFSLVISNPVGASFPPNVTEIVATHTIMDLDRDESDDEDNSHNDNDNGNTPTVPILQGRFIDSAVQGLEYFTPTQSGITSAEGIFNYKENERITFKIGGIELGSAIGAEIITPLEPAHNLFRC